MRFPSVKPAQTRLHRQYPMLQNCWHIERKLLTSGNAVPSLHRPREMRREIAARRTLATGDASGHGTLTTDNRATTTVLFPQAVDKYVDSSSSFFLVVTGSTAKHLKGGTVVAS